MRQVIIIASLLTLSTSLFAQDKYQFKTLIDLDATDVISQGHTGTCWSFSASSFLESEIMRLTGNRIDLSEMYSVRNTYSDKAENYVMRQGKAQFSEGGLAHDVMNAVRMNGLVPLEVYNGLSKEETYHNHSEMEAVVSAMLDTYIKNPGKSLSTNWKPAIESVLDIYLGNKVDRFDYNGVAYTPKSFLEYTKIVPEDYISLTSFTQEQFYKSFILNIPDNFSNGSFHNLPLDDFIETLDNALTNGFTVEFDCDVSEKTFSSKNGVAFVPANLEDVEKGMTEVINEKNITQDYRQQEFENYNTTDDHLMHITGTLKDQNGTKYYKVKNSWGSDSDRVANGGYVYFSEAYMRLKTISITIHKEALPNKIANKLKL
jgi:bleomycin hydrolase